MGKLQETQPSIGARQYQIAWIFDVQGISVCSNADLCLFCCISTNKGDSMYFRVICSLAARTTWTTASYVQANEEDMWRRT